jgi:hypothetical protein
MSGRLTPGQARGLVEARLSRSTQDALEAAVCLEAWGGTRTEAALGLAAGVVRKRGQRHGRSAVPRPEKPTVDRRGVVAEGIALVLAITAVAMWATPLSAQLGAGLWNHALVLALPVTFALQWALRSRYLVTEEGLAHLRADLVPCAGMVAVFTGALASTGPAGAIAALLVVAWVSGPVLVRRGWGLGYGLTLVAGALALYAGAEAIVVLWVLSVAILVAVVAALRRRPRALGRPPVPFRRVVIGAAIGCGLGLLVVHDDTIGWGVRGAFPALALVPSTLGGFWCGFHLWHLHDVLPRSLRAVSFERVDRFAVSGEVLAVVSKALTRLVVATVALSLAVVALAPWTSGVDDVGLLVAFGCFALVSALVGIAAGFGHLGWAFAAVVAAVATEALVAAVGGFSLPGAALIAGSIAGALLALPPVIRLSVRPGRAIATSVWIA